MKGILSTEKTGMWKLHDPGWVNNELQSYVDSPKNIYIKDGSLVLKPVDDGE